MTAHDSPDSLETLLDAVLLPQGCARTRRGRTWRRRAGAGIEQQAGLRRGRLRDTTAAVYFGEAAP